MPQHKIDILTFWYGDYPWYIPYFINSYLYNSTVDFYIIIDNVEPIPNKPANVFIVHKKINDLKAIASEKLGFGVSIV